MAAVVSAVAACALASPAQGFEPRVPESFFGISATEIFWASKAGRDARVERHLDRLQETGVDWVRTSVEWGDIEPLLPVGSLHTYHWGPIDRYVKELAEHDLALMPMPRGVPLWAADLDGVLAGCSSRGAVDPSRFGDYGRFAAALVGRYGRRGSFWNAHPEVPYRPVTQVELWNEANWASYWCPTPDPEAYAGLVSAGAIGVHSADPEAQAVLGGLVTLKENRYSNGALRAMETGEFVRRMMATIPALEGRIDAIGVHTYDPDPEGDLRLLGWLRTKLDAVGLAEAEMLVTEVGWHTGTAEGSVSEQARHDNFRYLLNRLPRTDCGVSGVAPHAWFSDEQDPQDPEHWWGMVDPETADPYPAAVAYRDELALQLGRGSEPPPTETIRICGGGEPPEPPATDPRINPPRVHDTFFGVSTPVMPQQTEVRRAYYDAMDAARIGTSRDHFFWSHLEPFSPGDARHDFMWSQSDGRVLGLVSRGIRLLPTFSRRPGWLGASQAQSDAAFAAFFAAFARRYGPEGSFWNENRDLDPALAPREYEVWGDANLDHAAADGTASAAEHANTYAIARAALRSVDPGARAIVGLAESGAGGSVAGFIREMVAARPELRGGLDGVYVRIVQAPSIAHLEDVVRTVRNALDDTGNPGARLRIGFGWATRGAGAVSEEQRASLLAETASRLARGDCGVDGIFAYAWATPEQDGANPWDWFGIASFTEGALKPSGEAYRNTAASFLGYSEEPAPRAAVHPCSRPAPDSDGDGVADAAEAHPLDPAQSTASTQPPPVPGLGANPTEFTQDQWAQFRYGAPGAVEYQCRLDGAPYRSCGSSGETTHYELAAGSHTFRVRAVDSLGLVGAEREYTWTVDRTAPDTTLSLVGGGKVVNGRAHLDVRSSEEGASFWCQWQDVAWQPCPQPLELELSPGPRSVYAVAIDGAGNMDPTAARIDLDVREELTAPDAQPPIVAFLKSPRKVADRTPTVRFVARDASGVERVRCSVDGAAWRSCSSPYTTPRLTPGRHAVRVTASDAHKNHSEAKRKRLRVIRR